MARLGRLFVPSQPIHVLQRGNDRRPIFFSPSDYARYHEWLHIASVANGCAIHAYVLMPNHVHFLATAQDESGIPKTMQSLGRRYVRHVNWAYGRSGTLWEGRYRATLIDSEAHLFDCMRYIESNPVRAKLVTHPGEYQWSSYRANALGEYDAVVKPHPLFTALEPDAPQRHRTYRQFSDSRLGDEFIAMLRAATNSGWPLGDKQFRQEVADTLGRRVTPLPRGRPPRNNAA
jgi:putative transposase